MSSTIFHVQDCLKCSFTPSIHCERGVLISCDSTGVVIEKVNVFSFVRPSELLSICSTVCIATSDCWSFKHKLLFTGQTYLYNIYICPFKSSSNRSRPASFPMIPGLLAVCGGRAGHEDPPLLRRGGQPLVAVTSR